MRLPKLVYETLPGLYALVGMVGLWVGYRLHAGALSTVLSLCGFVAVIAGAAVWMRRRDYRATRDEYLRRGSDGDGLP